MLPNSEQPRRSNTIRAEYSRQPGHQKFGSETSRLQRGFTLLV